MSSSTVHVSGISPATSEKEVRDFFSFWYVPQTRDKYINANPIISGKIVTLSITPVSGEAEAEKSATVTFEKEA
jgi:hypothetical protein